VEIETPDFDAREVLERWQEIYDLFSPAWKGSLKRRLPGGVVRAVRRTREWLAGRA
jgi:hypothetical protein